MRNSMEPIRVDKALLTAAKLEGLVHRRSGAKQIEFWAALGRAVAPTLRYSDVMSLLQGDMKIKLEPETSVAVDPNDVFNALENSRKSGDLAKKVTSAVVYYEASKKKPGLLVKVDSVTGERQTGHFRNGKFKAQR